MKTTLTYTEVELQEILLVHAQATHPELTKGRSIEAKIDVNAVNGQFEAHILIIEK